MNEESALDRVRSKRKARKRKRTMRRVVPVAVLCALLVALYAGGCWFFLDHYYPGTTVCSVDASCMSRDDLARAIDELVADYHVVARGDGFELALAGSDIGVNADGVRMAQQAADAKHAYQWPLEVFGGRDESLAALPCDAELVSKAVKKPVKKFNKKATAPTDASLEFDDQTGYFSVVPETPGTKLDTSRVCAAIEDAVGAGQSEATLDESALVQPAITASDPATQEALKKANLALDRSVPLQYDGATVATPTHADMNEWIGANDDLTVKVRKGLFAVWTDQEGLWEAVDHSDVENAYVLDGRALAGVLEQALNSDVASPVAIPTMAVAKYSDVEAGSPEASWNAEEGRYLEVDIAHQLARLFSVTGDVLWESKVTTGNVSNGNSTPTGTFAIFDKKNDFRLLGEDGDGDGEYDYNLHVDYWMPFNEGIGLHDASWRKKYGGTYYLEEGSGGCVNLPKDAATALYAMIHIGDKVIVHE